MKSKCLPLLVLSMFMSTLAYGNGDIGFGKIKGYKVGNADENVFKVYLEDGYTNDDLGCNGIVMIRFSDFEGASRDERRLDQMVSTVIAAYMAGKKVRFYSHKDNCDATFVALQETRF